MTLADEHSLRYRLHRRKESDLHMNSHTPYRQPPLMKIYFSHVISTVVIGLLLPGGEHLAWLHGLLQPVVSLIPNAVRIPLRAPDPVFAQTFIGLSLLIAAAILLYFVVGVRGYRTRTFDSAVKRWAGLFFGWCFVLLCLTISWFVPLLDPLSKGRAYFLLKAATSSDLGVVIVMNQLLVGFPMVMLLTILAGHKCTNVRR